jgi:hypothetical protein
MSDVVQFPRRLAGPFSTPDEAFEVAQVHIDAGKVAMVMAAGGAFHAVLLSEKKMPNDAVMLRLAEACRAECGANEGGE